MGKFILLVHDIRGVLHNYCGVPEYYRMFPGYVRMESEEIIDNQWNRLDDTWFPVCAWNDRLGIFYNWREKYHGYGGLPCKQ